MRLFSLQLWYNSADKSWPVRRCLRPNSRALESSFICPNMHCLNFDYNRILFEKRHQQFCEPVRWFNAFNRPLRKTYRSIDSDIDSGLFVCIAGATHILLDQIECTLLFDRYSILAYIYYYSCTHILNAWLANDACSHSLAWTGNPVWNYLATQTIMAINKIIQPVTFFIWSKIVFL